MSTESSVSTATWTRWLYKPWTQLILISFVCFCDPGMYNCTSFFSSPKSILHKPFSAISGIGGSGQLDPTVAANATVALLAATAIAALTVVPTIFDFIGPRGCLLISGWTYPLYAGSLLCYNRSCPLLIQSPIQTIHLTFRYQELHLRHCLRRDPRRGRGLPLDSPRRHHALLRSRT
jgi:hypothetical protein